MLLRDSDPLHDTLQSISVPFSLLTASFRLFGDSLIHYHGRELRWDLYRFYPPTVMTTWAAFEAWLKISSEILVAVVPSLPQVVRDALLERREVVQVNGKIRTRMDRRSVLERYWLLLKFGCDLEFDRGSRVWQSAENVVRVRDSLVHYNVSTAPELEASQVWGLLEAVMLLFIAPSAHAKRTLLAYQFDLYDMLVQLHPLVSEFKEKPLHKDWPREAVIFRCPFDGIDEVRYPCRRLR